jgi:hypothetical protein
MTLLKNSRGAFSEDMFSSGMWFGKSPIAPRLTPDDQENLVKVLFLLGHSDFLPKESAAVGAASPVGFEISPHFFDRFWTIKQIPEDGNINDCIAIYADDPRFQTFAKTSSEAVQSFVGSIASRSQSVAATSIPFSARLQRLIRRIFAKN